MARPKSREGRYERIALDVREDLLSWLDGLSESRREIIEEALIDLKAKKESEKMSLNWNSDTDRYEGSMADGRKITVDGDAFAEARSDMVKDLVAEGKDGDGAYEQITNELLQVATWTEDMHGVSISEDSD